MANRNLNNCMRDVIYELITNEHKKFAKIFEFRKDMWKYLMQIFREDGTKFVLQNQNEGLIKLSTQKKFPTL